MSITISNWGFIWKYKRYDRKPQNDAAINQIILKSLTQGEWSSGHSQFSEGVAGAKGGGVGGGDPFQDPLQFLRKK